MLNARLTALQNEFQRAKVAIEETATRATSEGRDLSDAEQADTDTLYARIETLRPDIEKEVEKQRSIDATADALSRLGATAQFAAKHEFKRDVTLPTTGEYLVASFAEAAGKPNQFADYQRAVQQQGLGDTPGLVPDVVVGELLSFMDPVRYTVNALGTRPMWVGSGSRPRVVQHSLVAVQAAEFAELASRKMNVIREALARATYGGYVEVSEQDAEFTDPSALQVLVQDLAEQYGLVTNAVVAAALVAGATDTFEVTGAPGPLAGITSPAAWTGALYGAAGQVYTNSGRLPDTLFVSVDIWAALGQLVGADGHAVYPYLGTQNAQGTSGGPTSFSMNPLGFQFVVDPSFAADTAIVGVRRYAEVYEQIKGVAIGAFKPGTLATEVGYRGYLGTNIRAEAFTQLVNAA